MDPNYPTTKLEAGRFLASAAVLIVTEPTGYKLVGRDYNDRKAAQLLNSLSILLWEEVAIESWMADLGFPGCQTENSSIGGVPCIMSEEEN